MIAIVLCCLLAVAPGQSAPRRVSPPAASPRRFVPPSQRKPPTTKRVSVTADGSDVRELLKQLFESVGASYVLHPSVRGNVTLKLKDVPFPKALAALLRATSPLLILWYDGQVYSIHAEPEERFGSGLHLPDFTLFKQQVYFTSAPELFERLRGIDAFSRDAGVEMSLDTWNNSILISAPNALLREIRERIRLLDAAGAEIALRAQAVVTTHPAKGNPKVQVWEMSGNTLG